MTTSGASVTRESTYTAQSAGSPIGVIPPYSIRVRSTASSIGAKLTFRAPSSPLTVRLTSSFVDASTTHAA